MDNPDSISENDIIATLRKATLENRISPVICGAAFKNKGIQLLIDAIIKYLPSPLERTAITGINPFTEKKETRKPDLNEPFTAIAFKIATDPFMGRLAYSGSIPGAWMQVLRF